VPWTFWNAARNAWMYFPKGEKVTVSAYGQTWTTPGMASAAPEQLLPEWEVRIGGKTGLDYLECTAEMLKGVTK